MASASSVERRFASADTIIRAAMKHAEEADLSTVDQDKFGYRAGYLALRAVFRDQLKVDDIDHLRVAGYAVYGWMPTILKSFGDLDRLSKFLLTVHDRSIDFALDCLKREANDEGGALRTYNGSIVGTSKALHFFEPTLFPIWDSRIASLFGFKYQSHDCGYAYHGYSTALHQWLRNAEIPKKVSSFVREKAPADDPPSNLRTAEFALFLKGGQIG